MRKGLAPIIIILSLLAIFSLGGIVYFTLNQKVSPTQTKTSLSSPIPFYSPKLSTLPKSNAPTAQNLETSPSPTIPPIIKPGYYEDKNAGFIAKFPEDIVLANTNPDSYNLRTFFRSVKKEDLQNNNGITVAELYGFMLNGSSKSIKIGATQATTYVELAAWTTCDVKFTRILTFENRGYIIFMYLNGPVNTIIAENPSYFDNSQSECVGGYGTWKMQSNSIQSSMKNFYNDINSGKGSPTARTWYDDFDKIVSQITIY